MPTSVYPTEHNWYISYKNIGNLCAFPFAPYVADNLGRRASIVVGVVIMIGATALQTASQSVQMFIGARYVGLPFIPPWLSLTHRPGFSFMIGFGVSFAAASAPLLVTELAYPSQRAQLTSMYNTLWYLGSIMCALRSCYLIIWPRLLTFHSQRCMVGKLFESYSIWSLPV